MNDIEILEGEKIIESDSPIQLPSNFIMIGAVNIDDVKIYIKQDVYKKIEKFSKEDTSHERGGILIGDYIENSNKKNVVISAFIEAKYTDASAATLTFTHETWEYIHSQQKTLYPKKKIVGWQHTHPSYGIFLSNYDIFIQENFFNLPWQIAYVVDPIADTRGFFQWQNDKVAKTGGFYIFDDIGKTIAIKPPKTTNNKSKINVITMFMTFLTAILLILTIAFGIEKSNIKKTLNELIGTNAKIVSENRNLAQELQNKKSIETSEQSKEKTDGVLKFKTYKVQKGDTLGEICKKSNIDYNLNKPLILKINGISDENKIYFGEILYLPI